MFSFIDRFLNTITMYRLVLYSLCVLVIYALAASFFGFISHTPFALLSSLVVIGAICFVSNALFAKISKALVNTESQWITAGILFFILTPPQTLSEYVVVCVASVLAMGSKYIIAIHHKHIANPVAIALVIIALWGRGESIWWVGSTLFFPLVCVISILIVRKMRRFILALSFLGAALCAKILFEIGGAVSVADLAQGFFLSSPLFFFAGIMLTEPLTTPPTRKLQALYGALVGAFYGASFSFGPVFSSPELALCIGNVFSYCVSPRYRLKLFLKEKRLLASNLYEFVFSTSQKIVFQAGQYCEWTLPHARADMRGMRRYFTIASSPTESDIRLGVRIEPTRSSTFKAALMQLTEGSSIMASSFAGDFTLPANPKEKLVYIAGGIGVTPFRSMVRFLKDKGEKRDIIFFYANRNEEEIAYKELFDSAQEVGVRMVYVVAEIKNPVWPGYTGFLTKEILQKEVDDIQERTFYISGSHGMVTAFEKTLAELGVSSHKIHIDFFPGFA